MEYTEFQKALNFCEDTHPITKHFGVKLPLQEGFFTPSQVALFHRLGNNLMQKGYTAHEAIYVLRGCMVDLIRGGVSESGLWWQS